MHSEDGTSNATFPLRTTLGLHIHGTSSTNNETGTTLDLLSSLTGNLTKESTGSGVSDMTTAESGPQEPVSIILVGMYLRISVLSTSLCLNLIGIVLIVRKNIRSQAISWFIGCLCVSNAAFLTFMIAVTAVGKHMATLPGYLCPVALFGATVSLCVGYGAMIGISTMQLGAVASPFKAAIWWSHKRIGVATFVQLILYCMMNSVRLIISDFNTPQCDSLSLNVNIATGLAAQVITIVILIIINILTMIQLVRARKARQAVRANAHSLTVAITKFRGTAIALTLIFLSCNCPVAVVLTIQYLTGKPQTSAYKATAWLMPVFYGSSFFIYIFTSEQMRNELRSILRCIN